MLFFTSESLTKKEIFSGLLVLTINLKDWDKGANILLPPFFFYITKVTQHHPIRRKTNCFLDIQFFQIIQRRQYIYCTPEGYGVGGRKREGCVLFTRFPKFENLCSSKISSNWKFKLLSIKRCNTILFF